MIPWFRRKQKEIVDTDIEVVLLDIMRVRQGIARECIKVWDSMEGKLPSFEGFCEFYMRQKWQEWVMKARWN